MLLYLLDPNDADRAFVKFDPSDKVVLLVNNFGGLSNLELDALTHVARLQLGKTRAEKNWLRHRRLTR
jgi:triose/dihydroxyacetone kinase / FAD-AMP lyase (cyclizing)